MNINTFAQYYRPNGDRYVTPDDFIYGLTLNLDSASLLPRFPFLGFDIEEESNTNFVIRDIAQPCYTDTLLTIIGVAANLELRNYGEMHAYLCVADSNFEIHRTGEIPSGQPNTREYTEVFFDEPINVHGRFIVIWDNPKPQNYGVNDYNYYATDAGNKSWLLGTFTSVRIPEEYTTYARMLEVNRNTGNAVNESRYYWHNNTSDIVYYSRKPSFEPYWVIAYLFPIFGELDTTLECIGSRQSGSGIRDVSMVEKYTNIFPNPVVDEVNVQCSFKIKDIEVYNILGEQLLSKEVNAYNTKINTSFLPKGNYILRVKTSSGTTNKKLAVE